MSLTRNSHSVQLVGNLTKDPDARYLPNGTPVTNISMATNRQYKKGDETVKEVIYWKIAYFGKIAEIVAQYCVKGRMVIVEGSIRPDPKTGGPRIWEKQDGTKGASFEVLGEGIKFCGGGKGEGTHHKAADDDMDAAENTGGGMDGWGDEDIPV